MLAGRLRRLPVVRLAHDGKATASHYVTNRGAALLRKRQLLSAVQELDPVDRFHLSL